MSLTINVREAANATILQLAGRLTLGAPGPSVRDTVRRLLDGLRKNIVLHLSGVTYFDSFGLGQLIASDVEATSQGGAIKLLNLNKKTQDLMLLTKLHTVNTSVARHRWLNDEAALVLGVPEGTMKAQISRARAKLVGLMRAKPGRCRPARRSTANLTRRA
jgi:anti-sigma B factor antagonist